MMAMTNPFVILRQSAPSASTWGSSGENEPVANARGLNVLQDQIAFRRHWILRLREAADRRMTKAIFDARRISAIKGS
ncbi:hypothetical protein GGR13_002722 [Brevundimonas variabilis]|uniref:Uncharacterized protein n=1 Tax=Brevundimonas variabilis TaxID=74312 RepID=A0A7W9FFA4_9CAUL|nr:hypothetical protein [Brevundimonas variabilis]